MHTTDHKDLDTPPEQTQQATRQRASNAAHVASLLRGAPYPPL